MKSSKKRNKNKQVDSFCVIIACHVSTSEPAIVPFNSMKYRPCWCHRYIDFSLGWCQWLQRDHRRGHIFYFSKLIDSRRSRLKRPFMIFREGMTPLFPAFFLLGRKLYRIRVHWAISIDNVSFVVLKRAFAVTRVAWLAQIKAKERSYFLNT